MLVQPGLFDQATHLDTHALKIVKGVDETLKISSMAHLIGIWVVFISGAVDIVVRRVAIDESVEE